MNGQTWIIRTTEAMDDDTGDVVGTSVDEEHLPHDLWMQVEHWQRHGETVVDSKYDDNGRLRMVIFESFGTDYDRSAEVSFPVVWTRQLERQV